MAFCPCIRVLAAPPAWWSNRGATNANTAEDFAAANIGQLKQMASKARDEFNAYLPGGAGLAINNLVASWQAAPATGVNRNDFTVANLGQVKAISKLFYDRLYTVGYNSVPLTTGQRYPWDGSSSQADDFALCNLGQLKQVFSFDLVAPAGQLSAWWKNYYFPGQPNVDANADGDDDGLSNLQEFQSGTNPFVKDGPDTDGDGWTDLKETQQGSDPHDYFSQGTGIVIPKIFVFSGGGVAVPLGQYSAEPIVYKVVNSDTGQPLNNAPVTIAVTEGTGLIALASGGTTSTSLTVRTDANGLAKAYFKCP